jgi:hypothetical protein
MRQLSKIKRDQKESVVPKCDCGDDSFRESTGMTAIGIEPFDERNRFTIHKYNNGIASKWLWKDGEKSNFVQNRIKGERRDGSSTVGSGNKRVVVRLFGATPQTLHFGRWLRSASAPVLLR